MKYLSFFENFAFKAAKFDERASPLEYWCVMPVIWLLIIAMVPGDLAEFWGFLLQKQVPPLNPLYYESIMLFLLTFLPRLSLTVRRLHDSGKSGMWAKLPFIFVTSSLVLVLGMGSAIATTGMGGGMAGMGIFAMIGIGAASGDAQSIWQVIFAAAAVVEAIGWDAIWAALSEMTANAPRPDLSAGVSNIATGIQNNPGAGTAMLVGMLVMIGTPFIAALLHLFFMLLPSELDENSYGQGKRQHKTLLEGPKSDNPFAGYKYLYARSPEQEEARKISQKEEIRSLYQTRVLAVGKSAATQAQ